MNGMIINETEMAFIADWMLINDCVTGLIERRGKIVLTNSVLYKGKENEKIFGF